MNRPHSAVPQNFQIRSGRTVAVAVASAISELRESIGGLSVGSNSILVMPGQKREARLFALDVPGIHVFCAAGK
jgi:hypothetical protein